MSEEKNPLEEGSRLSLDFDKIAKVAATARKILPVAVQDLESGEVILLAYLNQLALDKSIETGIATFWSTSRNELWVKGKTSGNFYELKEILVNCEQNSLVFKVKSKKQGICHTFNSRGCSRNCYYRRLDLESGELINLDP